MFSDYLFEKTKKCSLTLSNLSLHMLTRELWPERSGPVAVWPDSIGIVKLCYECGHAAGCTPTCAQHESDLLVLWISCRHNSFVDNEGYHQGPAPAVTQVQQWYLRVWLCGWTPY